HNKTAHRTSYGAGIGGRCPLYLAYRGGRAVWSSSSRRSSRAGAPAKLIERLADRRLVGPEVDEPLRDGKGVVVDTERLERTGRGDGAGGSAGPGRSSAPRHDGGGPAPPPR